MKTKTLITYILFTVVLAGSWSYIKYLQTLPPIIKTVTKTVVKRVEVAPKGVLSTVVLDDLKNDLTSNYPALSINQKAEILTAILKSSKEFNISPLVIYALIATESSFRFYAISPTRTVTGSDGKAHKDNALGLMSIMWTIHNKSLIANNIISRRSELRQITPNIRAGTFILAKMIKQYKGIDNALRHYFGISKYAKIYLRKIQRKVGSLAWNKIIKE